MRLSECLKDNQRLNIITPMACFIEYGDLYYIVLVKSSV